MRTLVKLVLLFWCSFLVLFLALLRRLLGICFISSDFLLIFSIQKDLKILSREALRGPWVKNYSLKTSTVVLVNFCCSKEKNVWIQSKLRCFRKSFFSFTPPKTKMFLEKKKLETLPHLSRRMGLLFHSLRIRLRQRFLTLRLGKR